MEERGLREIVQWEIITNPNRLTINGERNYSIKKKWRDWTSWI